MENQREISKRMIEVARQCMAGEESLEEAVKQVHHSKAVARLEILPFAGSAFGKGKGDSFVQEFYGSDRDADKRFDELKKNPDIDYMDRYDSRGGVRTFRDGKDNG